MCLDPTVLQIGNHRKLDQSKTKAKTWREEVGESDLEEQAEGQQGHKKPRASFCFATNLKQTIISDLFVQKKDGILLLLG